jgi:FkbM family methyltransferase
MKERIKKILKLVGLLEFVYYIISLRHKTIWNIIFKSQKKQDRWVLFEVLKFKKKGYFLELAAADGITHSNTYAMEKLFDWQGICIEPNPYFLEKLKKNRNCVLDDSIINDKEEIVSFRIDNGQLGGIVAEDTDNNVKIRREQLHNAEIIEKKSVTLTQLLDMYNAPKEIDYFSLDVEGSEERVPPCVRIPVRSVI